MRRGAASGGTVPLAKFSVSRVMHVCSVIVRPIFIKLLSFSRQILQFKFSLIHLILCLAIDNFKCVKIIQIRKNVIFTMLKTDRAYII